MISSWNSSLRDPISPTSPLSQNARGISSIQQATYCGISTVAFLGNTLVVLVFVWDKKLLKKSYNILILALAIAGVLTTICLIINMAIVIDEATKTIVGEIICRLIWNRFLPYHLVIFSMYISLGLSAERWCAVVKPQKYSEIFRRSNVIGYILVSWALSILVISTALFGTVYNPSIQTCEFQIPNKGSMARVLVGIFQVSAKMFFPCLSIIGLYIHMVLTIRTSSAASAASKAKLRGQMTRMVGVASFMLIICFAPIEIFLLLAYAGKTELGNTTHKALEILIYVSSCVNPVIYGLSNKNYRQSYKKVMFALCPKVFGGGAREAYKIGFINRGRVEPSPQPERDNVTHS